MQRSSISAGVLAKYPIALGQFGNIRVFPLFGVDYEMSVSGKLVREDGSKYVFGGDDKRHEEAGDLGEMREKSGGGVDVDLSNDMFLRVELLYGLRTANKFEKDIVDRSSDPANTTKTRLGHGPTLKVGAGIKF
jgi:hypothetical protein